MRVRGRRWAATAAALAAALTCGGTNTQPPPPRSACDPAAPAAKVRALLVGVERYRERDAAGHPYFDDLPGSANDVSLLAEVLLRQGGASREDVQRLVGPDVTSGEVDGALARLVSSSSCGDTVFIHFSGHAWHGALALSDAVPRLGRGLLFERDLRDRITAIRNKGAFVVVHVDACLTAPLQLEPGPARWGAPDDEAGRASRLLSSAGGYVGIFAGRLAFERKYAGTGSTSESGPVGDLTFATVTALASGRVSARDLRERVAEESAKSPTAGRPIMIASDPDHVLLGTGAEPQNVVGSRIEIFEPKRTQTAIATPSVRVEGRATPAGDVLAVLVNGSPVRLLGDGRFEGKVSIDPGPQRLAIVAVFRDHSIATEAIEIVGPTQHAAAPKLGRSYALTIGNEDYRHLRRLATPVPDARAVSELLRGRFGFDTTIEVGDGRTMSLLLENVGRREVFAALSQVRRRLGEDDSLLVFYAGHGDRSERGTQAYWLPIDAEPDDQANWISADDVTSEVSLMNARHVLVVADSAFSGGMLLRGTEPQQSHAPELDPTPEREKRIENMSRRRSRHLMSSGGNEPVADSGPGRHSLFVAAFLKGLTSMPADVFTAGELFSSAILQQVASSGIQTPMYGSMSRAGDDGGDFVFRRRPAEAR